MAKNIVLLKILYIVLSYVVGSVLCAEISMRVFKRESLFKVSKNHNPGVANAFIYGGIVCGSVAVAGDLLKGILPVFLYTKIFKECDLGLALVILSLTLGHAYSIFHRFQGGMCIAVSFGIAIGLLPKYLPLLVMIVSYLALLVLRKWGNSVITVFTFKILIISMTVFLFLHLIDLLVWLGIVMMSLIVCLRVRNDLTEEEKKKVCCLFIKFG